MSTSCTMAPCSTEELSTEAGTAAMKISSKEGPISEKFAMLRRLVPLVANDNITHLNAAFMPPLNLVIHQHIQSFCSGWLHDVSPKSSWKATQEVTRALLGRYLNTQPTNITFTRDTTEGMGSFMQSLRLQPGDNIIILDCEHPSQAYGWLSLRSKGIEVRQVATRSELSGFSTIASAATFEKYVDNRTRCIGISSIMFHSGQRNDVADICAKYRPRGVHVLVDLTQHVGFANVDVEALGVSAAAFSLHKGLGCPLGFAALYISKTFIDSEDPQPPIVGFGAVGDPTEDFLVSDGPITFHASARRFEHANSNFLAAIAAQAALQLYLDGMGPDDVEQHLYSLGDALRGRCKAIGVELAGPSLRAHHAPHLYLLKLYGDQWTNHFKVHNVALTSFRWGVRVSFGFYSSLEDVERLVDVIQLGLESGLPK
ncbi:uncharacterized protein E0L32_011207 [Thyridium curvatum]|uniref:Aminotransferase class V domain-containing protein n=1 Tax=Thyridium curvatum TaxID=1093900 RepID=A0A507BJT5_9PEZI|nr:uncharacterized protein E0L32_011207 [Thyridium curvatum]TPX19134.1 hypothetical protein E0L32_011207 [Thyridium curvatum]